MTTRLKCTFKNCDCSYYIKRNNHKCLTCDHGDVWHSLRDTPSDNCLSFHQVCSQGQDCDQTYQILKQDYTKMATTFRHFHTLSSTFVIPITPPSHRNTKPRRAIYRKLDYQALNGLPALI